VGHSPNHRLSQSACVRPFGATCSSSQPFDWNRSSMRSEPSVEPQSPTTSVKSTPANSRIERMQSSVTRAVLRFAT
jgi:hypothetical protein